MNRRLDDLQALAAMAAANMRPTSIAIVLGRPTAWVERQLAVLEAAAAEDPQPTCEPAPPGTTPGELPGPTRPAEPAFATFLEQLLADIGGKLGLTYDELVADWAALTWVGPARGYIDPVREDAPAAVPQTVPQEPTHAQPPRPSPPRVPASATLEPEPAARAAAREAGRARATAVRALARAGAPIAPPAPVAEEVRRLKPVGASVVRFAGWFRAAGWALDETAELFDVGPEALAAALGEGVAA